jgi:glycosyltransferase involved in cell wall biosynthesis
MQKIQILMATYNGEKYIDEQLNSIINQSYNNWELLVRDDCSTDKTLKILADYVEKYPAKIKLIDSSGVRMGACGNFAELINNSNADYVMFSDQDDVWLPNKIERTLDAMKSIEGKKDVGNPILIHTDLHVVDEALNTTNSSMWKLQNLNPHVKNINRLMVHNNVTGCTMMINRALANMAKDIPEGAIMYDWWIALIAASFGEIEFMREGSMLYRQHGKNDIGAKNFNIEFIFEKFSNYIVVRRSIQKTQQQAKLFLQNFSIRLDKNQKALLKQYSDINSLNFLRRRLFLLRNSIYKCGLIRNIGLFVYI